MTTDSTAPDAPKKRRWYHNLADAYRITKRTYTWIPWALIGSALAAIAIMVTLGVLGRMNWVMTIILTIMLATLVPMIILSVLVKPAMYRQIDGTLGAVYAVITQIRRGWTVEEEPISATRQRDLVWRIIGRPGVVLISEGSRSRLRDLIERERKEAQRCVHNVPVHVLHVGHGEGEVPLAKLERALRKLPKTLRSSEVPLVAQRLHAMKNRRNAGIPKGIDPAKAKLSRRQLRGR